MTFFSQKIILPMLCLSLGIAVQSETSFAGCDCKCRDANGTVHLGDKLNAPGIKDYAERCRDTCAYIYSQPTEPVGACMAAASATNNVSKTPSDESAQSH